MKISGNTILITGGGSGIGRGLAEALQKEGNTIIIAGRRPEMLDKTAADNPGMITVKLDVTDIESIKTVSAQIVKNYPDLNVLINNAAIMRTENLLDSEEMHDAEDIITTNLLGPMRMTTALLPNFLKQPYAAIINISSGLGFVPLAMTPTYCATKAALHSYSETLRFQLGKTNIQVIEIIPPAVRTKLQGGRVIEHAMLLNDFIAETMDILNAKPDACELCVEQVKMLRFAEASGKYDEVFRMINQRM